MASTIRISILADAANAVRGLRNTGSAADKTGAQLTVLQRRVDKLDRSDVDIDVKTRGFKQAVAEIVTANLVLDRLRKGMPDLSFGLTGVANKLALVAAGALAATAAVLPLVAATLAVGSALGAAALGVGLFAAVAAPTFKAVTTAVGEYNTASHAYDRAKSIGDTKAMVKAQKAMASSLGALSPMQRAAALQTIAMNKAWSDLSDSQAPLVLGIISTAAGTLAQIIPKLTPAIDAMATAFKSVSTDALAGLAKSITPIVSFIQGQGAPAFKSLAGIIGNLLVVVGHIATAFAPLGNVILARLGPLTAAMRSINFDALAKSASALLPLVGTLLGNLGGALGNLVKAAAPLAGPVLKGLGDIAGTLKTAFGGPEIKSFVDNIAKIVPAVAPIVAVLVTAFLKFADIISGQLLTLVPKLLPIVKQLADVFVNVLTGLSPLLGPLLDLVGILVSFLPVLYPLITAFREAMIPVVKAVGDALVKLRPSFGIIVGAFKSLAKPIADLIIAFVKIVPVLITDLMPAFLAIVGVVRKILPEISKLFPVFAKLIPPIAGLVVALVKVAPILVSALVPAIIIVVTAVADLLTQFKPLFPVLTQVITAVLDGVTPVLKALGDALPSIVTAVGTLVQPLGDILIALLPILPPISQLAVALVQALVPAALSLVPYLVDVADAIAKAIPGAIAILLPVFSTLTSFVKDPAFLVLAGTIGGIVLAVKAWKAAQEAFNTVMGITNAVQKAYNAVMDSSLLKMARSSIAWVASKVATLASSVATGVATAAQWLFNVAMDANPIGLIVLAIAALVVGLIYAYKHSDTFRRIVDGAFRAVAGAFKFLWDGAKKVFDWLKDHWKLVLAIITGPVGLIVLYVTSHWTQIHDATVTVFGKIRDFFVGVFKWVRDRFTDFIRGVKIIWGGITSLVDRVVEFRNKVIRYISGLIQKFRDIAVQIIGGFRDRIVNGFNIVVDFFKSIPGKFLDAGKAVMQGLVDGIEAGLQWVRDKVQGLAALIPDWLKSVLGINSPSTVAEGIGTNVTKSLGGGVVAAIPHLKRALSKVGDVVTAGLAVSPTASLTGLSDSVTASIKTGVSAASVATTSGVPISTAGSTAPLPGITININVAPGADPAEVGRQAVAAIEAYERRTGNRRLLVA